MAKNLLAMQEIPGSGRILWRREWLPTPVGRVENPVGFSLA